MLLFRKASSTQQVQMLLGTPLPQYQMLLQPPMLVTAALRALPAASGFRHALISSTKASARGLAVLRNTRMASYRRTVNSWAPVLFSKAASTSTEHG
jgi:hypothetical protein